MFEQIEHPDVTAACRTGYPNRCHDKHSATCDKCGFTTPEDGDDDFFEWEDEVICGECFDKKRNEMSRYEIADLLGADRIA